MLFFAYQNDVENASLIGDRPLDKKINIEHSQKFNFTDPIVSTKNIKIQNEPQILCLQCILFLVSYAICFVEEVLHDIIRLIYSKYYV